MSSIRWLGDGKASEQSTHLDFEHDKEQPDALLVQKDLAVGLEPARLRSRAEHEQQPAQGHRIGMKIMAIASACKAARLTLCCLRGTAEDAGLEILRTSNESRWNGF